MSLPLWSADSYTCHLTLVMFMDTGDFKWKWKRNFELSSSCSDHTIPFTGALQILKQCITLLGKLCSNRYSQSYILIGTATHFFPMLLTIPNSNAYSYQVNKENTKLFHHYLLIKGNSPSHCLRFLTPNWGAFDY